MSQQPIAHSPDLARLRADGYTVAIRAGWLTIADMPFLDAAGRARSDGVLAMPITLAGDRAEVPQDHTAYFVGAVPHDAAHRPLDKIINHTNPTALADDLVAACYFSAKPVGNRTRYDDFHEKVVAYVGHIAGPAQALDPQLTAQRHRPIPVDIEDDLPHRYHDTASARAGTTELAQRLKDEVVGIIGLGGTGQYVLDHVAKTWVREIHPFDGDVYLTHNAFRSPGAASLDELNAAPLKVERAASVYGAMHTGIVPHPVFIDESNVHELQGMTFVFLAIDDAEAKKSIIEALLRFGITFVDLGMGVELVEAGLTGIVRTTLVTPEHAELASRIATVTSGGNDEYRSNIQISALNALNAAMGVLAWQKHRGLIADLDGPMHTTYSITGNEIVNEPAARPAVTELGEAA